jgi:hypothetical protein
MGKKYKKFVGKPSIYCETHRKFAPQMRPQRQRLFFRLLLFQWFLNFLARGTLKETRNFSRHPKYVPKFEMAAKIL